MRIFKQSVKNFHLNLIRLIASNILHRPREYLEDFDTADTLQYFTPSKETLSEDFDTVDTQQYFTASEGDDGDHGGGDDDDGWSDYDDDDSSDYAPSIYDDFEITSLDKVEMLWDRVHQFTPDQIDQIRHLIARPRQFVSGGFFEIIVGQISK